MSRLLPRYADWKAPGEDGQTLLWPDSASLIAQTRDNMALLNAASHVQIQNLPLPEIRQHMRQLIGHTDVDRPIVATGHQTELQHAGVWAKHAAINALAGAMDGDAYLFAVDSDAPKHLQIHWPGGGGPITDDPQLMAAHWSGRLHQPTPKWLATLRHDFSVAQQGWDFQSAIEPFFDAMQRLGLEETPLSSALVNATHALDWSLGLRHHAMLTSPMYASDGFLALAHHLCADAGEFAAAYNAALGDYRSENGISNPGRPMPDLKITLDTCEVPLWLDDLESGSRQRAMVVAKNGRWMLQCQGDSFLFDPAADGLQAAAQLARWLTSKNMRLAPRALALTLFLRLLVADQFIHGIGGGRYDQVLDALIAHYFKIEPPRFSVATATLFFPGAVDQERICLPCLVSEGHQLKHRVLGPEKEKWVKAIAAAPRKSLERAKLFIDLHRQLRARAGTGAMAQWAERYSRAQQAVMLQRTLFDRELFYGIQSRNRLEGVIGRYKKEVT
jgi:hypothetical protein